MDLYDFIFHPLTFIAALVLSVCLIVKCENDERNDCHKRGGKMVITGSDTTMIWNGHFFYPVTTQREECSVGEE